LSSTGQCFDIGNTTRSELSRFEATGDAVNPVVDEEAAANGSLMRLAPVAIRYHRDVAEASGMAAESSRSTHAATRPVDACRVLGATTAALIGGAPADEVLAPEFWRWGTLHPEIEAVARGSWRGKEPPAIRGTGYCVDALETALWAVGGASNFADAVLRAANLGDDADTTAAIAGQLAGARWGAAGIPQRWRQRLVLEPRVVELATRLFRAGRGEPPAARWPHDDFVHAWWVEPGKVLAGEYPGDRKPPVAAARVNLLVDAGIRTFVDLTTPEDRLQPYAAIVTAAATNRRLDLRYCNIGIPDFSVGDDATYDELLDLIRRESGRGGVFVHCWGGIGRTGTVVGCLLAAGGLGYDDIVGRLAALREGTRKSVRPAPEADSQHEVLRRRSG
jgi:protein-tyrosine phosphatase